MEASSSTEPLEVLRRTRPWLRLLGLALLLGAAVTVLIGLVLAAIGIVASGMLGEEGEAHVGPVLFLLGLALLPFSLVYVYPGIVLLRAASRIPGPGDAGAESAASASIDLQRRFWRYVGAAALLALAFQALMLVLVAAHLLGLAG